MSAVAAAIGIGAVATVGAGMMAADAQKDAASKQRKSQRETNQMNYDMFRESRGEGGSAVLPLYLQSKDGGLFEKQLGEDLVGAYDMTAPDRAMFDAVSRSYQPMVSSARDTAAGIFNGGTERQLLDNFAPVAKARVKFKRQSALDSLHKTLGEINAVQAGRGFTGDSLGRRMLSYKANAGAADAIAGANLQNLEQEKAIKDAALQLKLQNLDLPFSMAGKEMEFSNIGNTAYLDAISKRMVPFNFLRIGQSQPFQYQPLTYSANPSAAGVALQGLGQAGGTAANYFMQQKQNQEWQQYLNNMQSNNAMASVGVPQQFYYGSSYNPAAAVPATTGFDYTPTPAFNSGGAGATAFT